LNMIGILGGTFDPIHNGHLQIANQVFSALKLDQIQFMPCAIPVHRMQPQTPSIHRQKMIEIALSEYEYFEINTLELERNGLSYTVDSLKKIRQCSSTPLALILGADAFNGFPGWKLPDEILAMANIVVCQRPRVEINYDQFQDHWVTSAENFLTSATGSIFKLKIDELDCSSSQVRKSLAAGESVDHWLRPGIASYIQSNQLYRSPSETN
jgi:nicotinate-nucleotide adenylyltransferase